MGSRHRRPKSTTFWATSTNTSRRRRRAAKPGFQRNGLDRLPHDHCGRDDRLHPCARDGLRRARTGMAIGNIIMLFYIRLLSLLDTCSGMNLCLIASRVFGTKGSPLLPVSSPSSCGDGTPDPHHGSANQQYRWIERHPESVGPLREGLAMVEQQAAPSDGVTLVPDGCAPSLGKATTIKPNKEAQRRQSDLNAEKERRTVKRLATAGNQCR
jgi:hypothetical protein